MNVNQFWLIVYRTHWDKFQWNVNQNILIFAKLQPVESTIAIVVTLIFQNILIVNIYPQTSDISDTLIGNKIADHSDVVGASPVNAAPTTSSFLT